MFHYKPDDNPKYSDFYLLTKKLESFEKKTGFILNFLTVIAFLWAFSFVVQFTNVLSLADGHHWTRPFPVLAVWFVLSGIFTLCLQVAIQDTVKPKIVTCYRQKFPFTFIN